jgi:hypothetical protein
MNVSLRVFALVLEDHFLLWTNRLRVGVCNIDFRCLIAYALGRPERSRNKAVVPYEEEEDCLCTNMKYAFVTRHVYD